MHPVKKKTEAARRSCAGPPEATGSTWPSFTTIICSITNYSVVMYAVSPEQLILGSRMDGSTDSDVEDLE